MKYTKRRLNDSSTAHGNSACAGGVFPLHPVGARGEAKRAQRAVAADLNVLAREKVFEVTLLGIPPKPPASDLIVGRSVIK